MPKNKLTKLLGKASMDIYDELGGLNFDEKDFQIALGYELDSNGIEYLKEKLIFLILFSFKYGKNISS